MELLDFMNADAFSEVSLTHKINHIDHKPGRLGQLGIFQEEGIATLTVVLEEDNQTIKLVKTGERGKPPTPTANDKRKVRSFVVPHIPTGGQVLADEIQNVRAYGAGNRAASELMAVETVVERKLNKMRGSLEATLEYHRMGALKGQVLDADGTTVLFNLFTEFGVSQQTHNMALTTGTTQVLTKIREAKRLSLTALKGDVVSGWHALCGDSFYDKFIGHGKVEDKYLNYQAAQDYKNGAGTPYDVFSFGNVSWENYRGTVTGSDGNAKDYIASGEAYLFPIGVQELFVNYFSPADHVDTVNTLGLPFYVFREMMKMGKGIELESQTNPLCLCTKPRAIIKLTES